MNIVKVTGYKIRGLLKSLEMKRDALLSQFSDSLQKYPDEQKERPEHVMELLQDLEDRIARLQALQTRYNEAVVVEIEGKEVSLSYAVKRVGSLGRAANLWKAAAKGPDERDSYGYAAVRREGEVHRSKVLTPLEATNLAIAAEKLAGHVRAAIAEGNARELAYDLDPDLLRE